MEIETKKWIHFSYTNFFELLSVTKKVSKNNLDEFSKIPVISTTSSNNGVFGYTSSKAEFICTKKIPYYITFGDHTRAFFIQDKSFSVTDNIKVLRPRKDISKNVILFILTVWRKSVPNLGYSRHWSIAKNKGILLPVNKHGKPDYEYMNSFIQTKFKICKEQLFKIKTNDFKKTKISLDSWQEFSLTQLFGKPEKPKKRSIQKYESGETPYVTSSKYNNGVINYLAPKNKDNIEKGKCITVNPLDATSFWQEEDFLARGGGGSSIFIFRNPNLNKYNAFFICTILRKKLSVEYNDMANSKTFNNTILLPASADKDGEPDWQYMEKFIKNKELIYKKKLKSILSQ